MLNVRTEILGNKMVKALGLTIGLFYLTWVVSGWVINDNYSYMTLAVVGCAGVAVFMAIMNDWRSGVFLFLGWLVLEDQIRKYLGNGTMAFFAKDVIAGMTYASMLVAMRKGKLLTFKPPFLIWLGIFFWMAALQVLNPNSPSVFYGLLGMKTYFYYVPLMFAGYAILRVEADLYKLLMLNMWIALFVSGLGLLQSFGGGGFLTPATSDVDLYDLSHVGRGEVRLGTFFVRPTSVFVSDGRYAQFLILLFVLAFGTAGYLLMRAKRGRYVVFGALGVVAIATVMTGSRGAFVYLILDTIVLSVALLWGAPWRHRQAFRLGKVIRNAFAISALAIVLAVIFFPEAVRARWALYVDTLSPTSANSELRYRAMQYPAENLESVFSQPNWKWGNGTGVASLGTQYVARAFGVPRAQVGAESGYGALVSEFGIIGPILWIVWTTSLVVSAWKVVRKLKQTPLFPVAFAIFWYAFMVLVPFTFYTLNGYQNYLTCAYLWLTIGMLYRLPGLLAEQQAAAAVSHAKARA